MADLTGFQRDLLFVLSGMETPSGCEIMLEIETAQDRSVLHGQLYSSVDELVEERYVEKGNLDGRTNYYSITDDGYEKHQNRHEWEGELLKHVQTPRR